MFYDYFDTGLIGTLTLVGDEQGLRYIFFQRRKTLPPSGRIGRNSLSSCAGQSPIAGLFQGGTQTVRSCTGACGDPFSGSKYGRHCSPSPTENWSAIKTSPKSLATQKLSGP